jgi:uncharacterized protein (DUF58 family)
MRRCAQGLGLLVVLLFTCAFILDDMAVLFAGATLLACLLVQYLSFESRFRRAVASLSLERTLERTMVRKGATVRVATVITLTVPAHLQVTVSENIPSGVVIQDGETSVVAGPGLASRTHRLTYRVGAMLHGTISFSGLTCSARDFFFENSIVLSSAPFGGQILFVQPRGLFEPSSKRATSETREIEKMSVLSGYGIRAIREYYTGDDLRRIDWKLSAKHDKLFVREYTGVMSLPPLLVVDLPLRGAPYSVEDFGRMVAAVAGIAEYSVRTYQYVSVIIISGPNILHVIGEEKDLQRCMSVLREWMHPVERTVHFYRTADRSDLRRQIRALEAGMDEHPDPGTAGFLSSLHRHYSVALSHQRTPAFIAQIVRALSPLAMDEVYIFSLAGGDTSHLRQIIRQAKTMKLRVHLRMPGTSSHPAEPAAFGQQGADTVEAFT